MTKIIQLILVTVMAFSASAFAKPSADLIWEGSVPVSTLGDVLSITGISGNKNINKGSLDISPNGTFSSSVISIESRNYDFGETLGLEKSNWKLASKALTMGSADTKKAQLNVYNDGESLVVGGEVNNVSSLNLTVNQKTPLAGTSGDAQVLLTLIASVSL